MPNFYFFCVLKTGKFRFLAGEGTDLFQKPSNSSSPLQDYTGTWEFTSASCDGVSLVYSGLTERIILNQQTGKGSSIFADNNCTVTETFDITEANGNLFSTNESYSCSTNGCTVDYTVTASGSTTAFSHTCPDDFPLSGGNQPTLSQNGDILTVTVIESGVMCSVTYVRASN
jgi:hypothetical protein